MSQQASLLFLLREGQILLAMKKRGFGAGRWNGVGGKPEPGETIEQTATRECQEEIGVLPHNPRHVASLTFIMHESDEYYQELNVEVFVSREWQGEPVETEEMSPKWFSLDGIPYGDMWADDIYWLPEVLKGNFVTAIFHFNEQDRVIDHSLETMSLR